MRATIVLTVLLAVGALAQNRTSRTLDIYVVDVEGGNATLFISPSGESLLIDTGNAGAAAARDAGRIMAAAKDAGLQQIDHLITTHWHGDQELPPTPNVPFLKRSAHFRSLCMGSFRGGCPAQVSPFLAAGATFVNGCTVPVCRRCERSSAANT